MSPWSELLSPIGVAAAGITFKQVLVLDRAQGIAFNPWPRIAASGFERKAVRRANQARVDPTGPRLIEYAAPE